MSKRNKKILSGIILLIVGAGLLIGGAFIAPLLAPGGAAVMASIAILKSANKDRAHTNPAVAPEMIHVEHSAQQQLPSLPPGMHWHMHASRETMDLDSHADSPELQSSNRLKVG
jgi:hypothetical protein